MEVLRENDLCAKLKVSPNTARKIRKQDKSFPRRVVIFGEVEGWLSVEVDEWLSKRPRSARQ